MSQFDLTTSLEQTVTAAIFLKSLQEEKYAEACSIAYYVTYIYYMYVILHKYLLRLIFNQLSLGKLNPDWNWNHSSMQFQSSLQKPCCAADTERKTRIVSPVEVIGSLPASFNMLFFLVFKILISKLVFSQDSLCKIGL